MTSLENALMYVSSLGLITILAFRVYTLMDKEDLQPAQYVLKRASLFFIVGMLFTMSFLTVLSDPTVLLNVFLNRLNTVLFSCLVIILLIDGLFFYQYILKGTTKAQSR